MTFWNELSNRQQNILAELVLEAVIIIYFVQKILGLSGDTAWVSVEVGWIIAKTIGLAIVGAITLSVIINWRGEEPSDERDHRIASRAYKVAYLSLCVGVCFMIALICNSHIGNNFLFGGPENLSMQSIEMNHLQTLVALLAILVGSSMIKSVTQLYLYHWGKL